MTARLLMHLCIFFPVDIQIHCLIFDIRSNYIFLKSDSPSVFRTPLKIVSV